MTRIIALIPAALVASGCVSFSEAMEKRRLMVELTDAGQDVAIVDSVDRSCAETDRIDTRVPFGTYDEEQNLEFLGNYLRNVAAQSGANTVVVTKEDWYRVTGDPAASHVGVEIEALTYACR